MKTFITRDTTLFPIPSGYIFFDGFKKLGWKTYYIPLPSEGGKNLIDYEFENEVDILFDYQNILSNPNHINDLTFFKNKNPNCKIFVTAFLPYNHNISSEIDKRFEQYEGLVDYFFNSTIQHKKAEKEFKKLGFKYLSIPYPAIVEPIENYEYFEYDASFIGTIDSGERLVDIWYPKIIKPNYKTYLAGFRNKSGVSFEDMMNISIKTKINLNPHYIDQIEENENNIHSRIDFNTRVFNLSALGCFQLTNHPSFKIIFGEDCPVFDHSSFNELFDFYINNPEERFKIIKKMQDVTINKFTSKIFAEKISQNNFNFI